MSDYEEVDSDKEEDDFFLQGGDEEDGDDEEEKKKRKTKKERRKERRERRKERKLREIEEEMQMWFLCFDAKDKKTVDALRRLDSLKTLSQVKSYPTVDLDPVEAMKYVYLSISVCLCLRTSPLYVFRCPSFKFNGYESSSPFFHPLAICHAIVRRLTTNIVDRLQSSGQISTQQISQCLHWLRLARFARDTFPSQLQALRHPTLTMDEMTRACRLGMTACTVALQFDRREDWQQLDAIDLRAKRVAGAGLYLASHGDSDSTHARLIKVCTYYSNAWRAEMCEMVGAYVDARTYLGQAQSYMCGGQDEQTRLSLADQRCRNLGKTTGLKVDRPSSTWLDLEMRFKEGVSRHLTIPDPMPLSETDFLSLSIDPCQ